MLSCNISNYLIKFQREWYNDNLTKFTLFTELYLH